MTGFLIFVEKCIYLNKMRSIMYFTGFLFKNISTKTHVANITQK